MKKQAVMLLSGTRFERAARMGYTAVQSYLPSSFLSPEARKGRDYDRLTTEIAHRALSAGGNSIDVGAHCGSILRQLLKFSPRGQHWAFEPIPNLATQLQRKYPSVHVEQIALADYSGTAEFRFIPAASAYSSLLTRSSVETGKAVRPIGVNVRRLDDVVPEHVPIAFIKIDVEGGEAAVFRGAANTLRINRPIVVFECDPVDLMKCIPPLKDAGLHIYLLSDFVEGRARSWDEVVSLAHRDHEYYFVASRP